MKEGVMALIFYSYRYYIYLAILMKRGALINKIAKFLSIIFPISFVILFVGYSMIRIGVIHVMSTFIMYAGIATLVSLLLSVLSIAYYLGVYGLHTLDRGVKRYAGDLQRQIDEESDEELTS
jgi:hypothetical protein